MTGPVVIGNAELWLGDCREILPQIGKVNALVTDPPFGIGFKYESHRDTPEGYGEWLWSVVEECERHCEPGSPIFVWQAMLNVRSFAQWFPRDWRLFAGAKNFVQMRKVAMQHAWDPVIVWWTEGEQWRAGKSKICNRDFHVANTASVVSNPNLLQRQHPCPRPLDQVRFVIEQWARPASIVLDPFMGSGTTGVACAQLGRRFVGIEIDQKYFDLACKRMGQAQQDAPCDAAQMTLQVAS